MTNTINTILGWPGYFILKRLSYLLNLTTFTVFALRDWFKKIRLLNRDSYRPLVSQIIFTGIDAMPVITILALIIGFVFTFRLIALFDSVGDTVTILVYLVGLEIGPMMSAFTLISRTGSAIAVDIGNMKLHKEIEALEYMGIDINEYMIAPRILGATISQLAVAVFFTLISMVSGILLSGLLLSKTHFNYLTQLAQGLDPIVLPIFIAKNILFGLIIGATACYHGLKVDKSPTEVPQQTQKAIVNTLVMLFLIDGIFALLLI
ncbi:MAG: ABC transporter permease [Gammaproteobacteria bacterium]|nr:ABC transporter permease [Gammaproteobacteria bacterium]